MTTKWFCVISIFPEWFEPLFNSGITGRANKNNIVKYCTVNPRDFTEDNYKRVDERPYGGGAGMVMMAEPLAKAIKFAKTEAEKQGLKKVPVVYLSPQGRQLNDDVVNSAISNDGYILLCGRYDGIDERIIKHYVDIEYSIGDYVLSGGELAAMVFIDTVTRKLPHVLGDENSAIHDSFVNGLLDYPQYTKPTVFEGETVPDILKSGNHKAIAKWRFLKQYEYTLEKRPDLIKHFTPDKQQQVWLKDFDSVGLKN